MIVSGPSREHVRFVADSIRAKDAEEFISVSFAEDRKQLADMLVERYGENDATYCFSDGETPVAVGAMVEGRPNVITIMFFATDLFPVIALPLARFCRQRLFPRYRNAGVHRIECIAVDGYDASHRWIEILGMKREAVLRGFGKNGETFHQFAWVADHVR